MVQLVSFENELKIELQRDKKVDRKNSDFLELFLKRVDKNLENNEEKTTIKLSDNEIEKSVEKEEQEIEEIELEKIELKEITPFLSKEENSKIVKEIKNIIISKIKQDNLLNSEQIIKEFKKIEKLEDLVNFLNKKGLNIKKIVIQLPKEFKKIENRRVEEFQSIFDKKKELKKGIIKEKIDRSIKRGVVIEKKKENKGDLLETILNRKMEKNRGEKNQQIQEKQIISLNSPKTIKNSDKIDRLEKVEIKEIQIDKIDNEKIEKFLKEKKVLKNIEKESEIDLKAILQNRKEEKRGIKEYKDNSISIQNITTTQLKIKQLQAKETIKHFKYNLDEAIKNYKPPISKIDIELTPKNLGKIEVSIIKRGEKLHIKMRGEQQNSITLFQTNQIEFKQALNSIGFSNIEMSFNSNQDKNRRDEEERKGNKKIKKSEEIGEIEIVGEYRYA